MTVGVALVGHGYWGSNLARNLVAAPSIDLVGVADGDPDRRAEVAQRYPGTTVWDGLEGALADPAVEAVVLATPASAHAGQAVEVLGAGRHVLVEKPLATTIEGAEAIVAAAAASGKVAMVGHTFLYSPPVLRLRELIAAGDLGKIQYLYSQRLSLGRIRSDCDALWNLAPHDVAMLCYLLHEVPVEVTAKGFSFLQHGIDDVCFGSLQFASGVGANIHVSWIDPRKTRLMTVVGDEKMAVFNDVSADQKIWLFDSGVARSENPSLGDFASMGEFQWRTRSGDILIPQIKMVEPLLVEVEEFARACRGGPPPRTDARHGLEVVRTLTALTESARMGGAPVRLSRPDHDAPAQEAR